MKDLIDKDAVYQITKVINYSLSVKLIELLAHPRLDFTKRDLLFYRYELEMQQDQLTLLARKAFTVKVVSAILSIIGIVVYILGVSFNYLSLMPSAKEISLIVVWVICVLYWISTFIPLPQMILVSMKPVQTFLLAGLKKSCLLLVFNAVTGNNSFIVTSYRVNYFFKAFYLLISVICLILLVIIILISISYGASISEYWESILSVFIFTIIFLGIGIVFWQGGPRLSPHKMQALLDAFNQECAEASREVVPMS